MTLTADTVIGRSSGMRRLVVIFLAFLVVFQASWAVAAPYCRHEGTSKATHLGHHPHEHASVDAKKAADTPDGTVDSSLPGADSDCSTCHAATAALLFAAPRVVAEPLARERFVPPPSGAPPAPVTRIDRPNWPALA